MSALAFWRENPYNLPELTKIVTLQQSINVVLDIISNLTLI